MFMQCKEGFESASKTNPTSILHESNYDTNILEGENQRNNEATNINQMEINELTNMQNTYSQLYNEINTLQREINQENENHTNRISPSNPYLNKNIKFNTNELMPIQELDANLGGYVTNKGVFKSYPDVDTYNTNAGNNGCPKDIISNVTLNNFSGSLLQGSNVTKGQSCGNEGKNVYTTKLVNNVRSSYIGCYNDRTSPTITKIVPKMSSSNSVNGFTASATSIYQNNNKFGAWCAFDQNKNTFWHSNTTYNKNDGIYSGSTELSVNTKRNGMTTIKGERIQINMSPMKLTSYDLQGRQNTNGRNPNTWYIVGYKDNEWFEVDYRENQNYDKEMKNYIIHNPGTYEAYALITTRAGNSSAPRGSRNSVQISIWNLYSTVMNSNEENAMIFNENVIGYTSFNNCESYALENGYKYFGMRQNGACLVSNDLAKVGMYGDGTKQMVEIPLWATNSANAGITNLQLLGTGQLVLMDSNNNLVRSITNARAQCKNDGKMEIISATYGGNCHKSNVSIGNVTNIVSNDLKCNDSVSCAIPISNNTFGDPARGCGKSFSVSYKCGNQTFNNNMRGKAEGKTINLDCTKYIQKNCTFVLIVQDDGNVCIFLGADPSNLVNRRAIWCSNTNRKTQQVNQDWLASNGKFGRNYMKMGESLALGEWIGSNNGRVKLQLELNGNLVIYTTTIRNGCIRSKNKMYGNYDNVNAVYELEQIGNIDSLNKVAYIDDDSKLRPYPQSMLGKSNNYAYYPNFDTDGNTLKTLKVKKMSDCVKECNKNELCNGFTFQKDAKMCYLKSENMSARQYNKNFVLGIRKPSILANNTCSSDIVDIDTIRYDNYVKGEMMTSSTKCNEILNDEKKKQLMKMNNDLMILGKEIATKMTQMYDKDNNIHMQLNMNEFDFKNSIEQYEKNSNKLASYIEELSIDKIEGMRSMNDVNGMLSNSDIVVLHENYNYMMWSIIALGLITIAVNRI
jgi:hypothetical protein